MMYFSINIVLFFIMILGLLLIFKTNKKGKLNKSLIDKYYKKIIIALFIIMAFTSLYKLGSIPDGIMVDEVGTFYDARLIARFGYDRYFNRFPIYLINYGGGQSVLYAYLVAFFIKIFGNHFILVRFPQVIFRFITFFSAYRLVKNEEDKLKRLVFLTLITIVPYFIMKSRWGLECNIMVDFMTISITLLFSAVIKKKNIYFFLSGLFLGLTLYTYAVSYIIIPVFLLFTIIYLFYIRKINIKNIIIFSIPLFVLAIPLILMILVNNGVMAQINSFITIPILPNYRGSEISILNVFYSLRMILNIIIFDNIIYNSIPYFGTIYYISIPFVFIGIIFALKKLKIDIKKKKFSLDSIMVISFFSIIICMLVIQGPNINKANAIFIPLLYITAIGITKVVRVNKYLFRFVVILYILNFILFGYYYYHVYKIEFPLLPTFEKNYIEALDLIDSSQKEFIYINPRIAKMAYIYVFAKKDADPKYINTDSKIINNGVVEVNGKKYYFEIPEELDDNSLLITDSIDGYDKEYKQIGDIYIINY